MKMTKSYFNFGGVSSRDFGLTIEKPQITKKPLRKVTTLVVPGRDRYFMYDDGAYTNVEVRYSTWCADQRERDLILDRLGDITRWLSGTGYKRLSDTYDPDYFRMGVCLEPLDPEVLFRKYAKQDIVFSCDPYRYSFAGDELQIFNTVAQFEYAGMETFPYIKIKGSGSLTLTVETVQDTVSSGWSADFNVTDYLEIDCMTKDTFRGTENMNDRKTGRGYPSFAPGEITVMLTGAGADSMEIRPRWRTL